MSTNNTRKIETPRTRTDRLMASIQTLAIIVMMIGVIGLFFAPESTGTESIGIESTEIISIEEPEIVEAPVPQEYTEIEILINDLIMTNPARKDQYVLNPDKTSDVHVCTNMAVDQAQWISENYGYETGIVMLWNKYIGYNHVQTWVDVDGVRYVIESTSHGYWTVEEHADYCRDRRDDRYKIQFTNIKKGLEREKENNEILNNKNHR